MTNPRKLFVNFTISHLKMAGYEFLRTSRGGVMLQDSQQFQYYMKNVAANPDLGTRNIFADLTVKVFWSS